MGGREARAASTWTAIVAGGPSAPTTWAISSQLGASSPCPAPTSATGIHSTSSMGDGS
ncbi:MAG: hypothetical protein HS111_15385 [Kofleriaceae bacterium]|nr:hypothetical protein [Kofleriaceae bacterium]